MAALQEQKTTGLHWFEPFGYTEFKNVIGVPDIGYFDAEHRIFFWDQEPLHRDRVKDMFDQFILTFKAHPDAPAKTKITLVTSEYQSDDVAWACDTYNMDSAYYFFHGWAALDWYRGYNHTYLYRPFANRNITHTLLCPNNIIGGKRSHRLELFAELVNHNIVNNNLVSFPDRCPFENKTVKELCDYYNISLGPVRLPLKIDNGSDYQNDSHKIDMWALADKSLLHVVTETVYNGRKQHLTEKTFKPIVMQQPFVIVSCQGSLEYLKKYGFKTFNSLWDESYDNADDTTRIKKIGQILKDIDNLSVKEKNQLQQAAAPIVEHNFNWFYSGGFEKILWQELTDIINKWK